MFRVGALRAQQGHLLKRGQDKLLVEVNVNKIKSTSVPSIPVHRNDFARNLVVCTAVGFLIGPPSPKWFDSGLPGTTQ